MNPALILQIINFLPTIMKAIGDHPDSASVWTSLTDQNSASVWNIFGAIASALGHTEGAALIKTVGTVLPAVAQIAPAHADATQIVNNLVTAAPAILKVIYPDYTQVQGA